MTDEQLRDAIRALRDVRGVVEAVAESERRVIDLITDEYRRRGIDAFVVDGRACHIETVQILHVTQSKRRRR